MSKSTETGLKSYSFIFLALSLVLAFIALICGFIVAANASEGVSGHYAATIYTATFIPFFIVAGVIAFFGFFIYLLINALAGIHENTRRTAELLCSNTPTFSNIANNAPAPKVHTVRLDEWRCKSCNKINKNYVTTCTCGQDKNKNN